MAIVIDGGRVWGETGEGRIDKGAGAAAGVVLRLETCSRSLSLASESERWTK
jgi:hypothetical protein